MAKSFDFSEYYKTLTNSELLLILENPDEYQPLAIQAAKHELLNRNVSDSDIADAKNQFAALQMQKDKQNAFATTLQNKIKQTGQTFFETINPIQTGIPSTEKSIRFCLIVLSLVFILDIKSFFAYLKDIARFPLAATIELLPYVILVSGIITFWRRMPIGWMLITIFLTFSSVGAMWMVIESILWKPSELAILDRIYPKPSITKFLFQILFFLGILYILCKANIRNIFLITQQRMVATIGLTAFVDIFLLFIAQN